jgi:hypothetical protein
VVSREVRLKTYEVTLGGLSELLFGGVSQVRVCVFSPFGQLQMLWSWRSSLPVALLIPLVGCCLCWGLEVIPQQTNKQGAPPRGVEKGFCGIDIFLLRFSY